MKIVLIFFFLIQTILFAENTPAQKVKLQLQWKYQFQFAGFIMAKKLGYYKDVGLNVELIEYNNSDIIQDLQEKKIDYMLSNSIIAYKNKKLAHATLIATYFQRSPLVIIAQTNIKSILDLKNKSIMISPEDHYNSSLTILLNYFGINKDTSKFISPTYNINDFINQKVDATTAFRSNELFELGKQNIKYNVFDPVEYGFSTSANNLFTSYTKVQNNPEQIKSFLSASKKGWEYALENIQEVAEIIHSNYNPNLSVEHLIYEGKIIKELMLLNIYNIGEINKSFVQSNFNKLIKNQELDTNSRFNRLYLEEKNLQLWIKEKYIQRTEYTFAGLIALFFITIISLLLIWSFKMKKEIQKRLNAEIALKHQAEHDALTNLPNRSLFLDRLIQNMRQAKRSKRKVAVLYVDIDHFKQINDSLGHNIGDILLQEAASRFKKSVRETDTVARVGGDEFIIILNNFTIIETILAVIDNIMLSLSQQFFIEKQAMYITLSIGISIYPDDGIDANTLIKNADAAMYKTKDTGRNNYQFYTPDMTEKAFQRVKLETQLRESLENNEMEVYYQLQIDASNDSILGMEALVRWNHPEMGLIPPEEFIPLSEEIGFVVDIDKWVMQTALTQFRQWHEDDLPHGVLSLNLSILRLEKDGFIDEIKEILKDEEYIQDCFSFEITETQIMHHPEKSIQKLKELNELGIKFSIDDFGTGHSALSYLKKLPISKLKIDRSFIIDIPKDEDDKEITKTIIAMAKNLNLNVIAEGVETQEQKNFLVENGCHEIQGYFYHKPSPAREIKKILEDKNI